MRDETPKEKLLREEKEYLEQRLDEVHRTNEEREQRSRDEREQRRSEWKQEWDRNYRTATTWPEALSKQAALSQRETWDEDETGFFTQTVAACNKALEIWPGIAGKRQAEIEALRAQLAFIQLEIQCEVADELARTNQTPGWNQVALALREDTDLNAWLNW